MPFPPSQRDAVRCCPAGTGAAGRCALAQGGRALASCPGGLTHTGPGRAPHGSRTQPPAAPGPFVSSGSLTSLSTPWGCGPWVSRSPRRRQACAGLPSAAVGIQPGGCPPCRQHPMPTPAAAAQLWHTKAVLYSSQQLAAARIETRFAVGPISGAERRFPFQERKGSAVPAVSRM